MYWIFIILGICTSLSVFYKLTNKQTFNTLYTSLINLIFIGFIGSFLFGFIETIVVFNIHHQTFHLSDYHFSQRWFGGLFCCFAFLIIQLNKQQFIAYMDTIVTAVCIGISIGKLGCFFEGHYGCYGTPTNLPWGKIFISGTHSSIVKVHPIQIYDSIYHVLLFLFLWYLLKQKQIKNGIVLIVFMLSTSIYNFFIEYIRTNEKVIFKLTFAQFTYVLISIIALFFYSKKFLKKNSNKKPSAS